MQEFTVMLVDGEGIKGLWCSGPCLADIHSISFIRQMEGMIIDRIEKRANFHTETDSGAEENG